MDDEKLSVIVPVYNVEAYLEECLESILAQTYTNLEIILVDDGSPDLCGQICDDYGRKDERVKVIHKENGGLSSARNVGIAYATGRYLTFVDSDDYIDIRMYEKMMRIFQEFGCDMVCCDYESEKLQMKKKGKQPLEWLSGQEAVTYLLDEVGFRCYAWNKIYKKEAFEDIRFPEGKCYEDIYVSYRLLSKADKIGYLREALYFYRYRENSIANEVFNKNKYDLLFAINQLLADVRGNNKRVLTALMPGYIRYYFYFINCAYRNDVEIKNEERFLRKFITRNYLRILFSSKSNIKVIVQSTSFMLSNRLYQRLLLRVKPTNYKNV